MFAEVELPHSILGWIFYGVLLVITVFGGGFLLFMTVRRSDDGPLLIFKLVLTVVVVAMVTIFLRPIMKQAGGLVAGLIGIPTAVIAGLVLGITWRKNIANLVANPLGNLYDGGKAEYCEARPVYSNAISLRNRGYPREALDLVRKELERFPTDIDGQLLTADILAENLNDLDGAAIAIQRFPLPINPATPIATSPTLTTPWRIIT